MFIPLVILEMITPLLAIVAIISQSAIASPLISSDDDAPPECLEITHPNNVAFDSLSAYRENKISFNPLRPDFDGNYVEILGDITALRKNDFATYESNYIIKLILSHKHLRLLETGSFLQLHCLHYLRLQSNEIKTLTMGIFQGLQELLELNLNDNQLKKLPTDVFIHLKSLRTLSLAGNRLTSIDSSIVSKLKNLVTLDLSNNMLVTVATGAFSDLGKLFKLDLSNNQLTDVPLKSWEHLDTLKSLVLSGNRMSKFDLDSDYAYNALVYLYLDGNKFVDLDFTNLFQRFPKILALEINSNPWNCDDLYKTVIFLNSTKIIYSHANITATNVNGFDCTDYSISTTMIVPTEPVSPVTNIPYYHNTTDNSNENMPMPSDVFPCSGNKECTMVNVDNEEVLTAISTVESISVCILVLVLLFVLFDFLVKSGVIERIGRSLRCTDGVMFDQNNAEHIRLLNSRPRF